MRLKAKILPKEPIQTTHKSAHLNGNRPHLCCIGHQQTETRHWPVLFPGTPVRLANQHGSDAGCRRFVHVQRERHRHDRQRGRELPGRLCRESLQVGESVTEITNTGANGASLLGLGFGVAAGNICVNVYAFDPGEELISCCSCLVTPDQTVNLGVNRDLTVKTLTGVVPTSVTVKLLATLAGGLSRREDRLQFSAVCCLSFFPLNVLVSIPGASGVQIVRSLLLRCSRVLQSPSGGLFGPIARRQGGPAGSGLR